MRRSARASAGSISSLWRRPIAHTLICGLPWQACSQAGTLVFVLIRRQIIYRGRLISPTHRSSRYCDRPLGLRPSADRDRLPGCCAWARPVGCAIAAARVRTTTPPATGARRTPRCICGRRSAKGVEQDALLACAGGCCIAISATARSGQSSARRTRRRHGNGGPRPLWFSAIRRCAPSTSKQIDSVLIVFHPPRGTFQLRTTHAP